MGVYGEECRRHSRHAGRAGAPGLTELLGVQVSRGVSTALGSEGVACRIRRHSWAMAGGEEVVARARTG